MPWHSFCWELKNSAINGRFSLSNILKKLSRYGPAGTRTLYSPLAKRRTSDKDLPMQMIICGWEAKLTKMGISHLRIGPQAYFWQPSIPSEQQLKIDSNCIQKRQSQMMKFESGPELQIFFKCTLWIVNWRPLGKTPEGRLTGVLGVFPLKTPQTTVKSLLQELLRGPPLGNWKVFLLHTFFVFVWKYNKFRLKSCKATRFIFWFHCIIVKVSSSTWINTSFY